MIAPVLLTVALASAYADDAPDVAGWIGRLGAEAFDDRVAAYKAIERLGPSALPALNAAAGANDPRVRTRVRALIDTISRQLEADRFARPTLIRLDFGGRPLGEIVDTLNDRYDLGLLLRLGPEPMRGMRVFDPEQPNRLKALRERVVRLEAAEPVPYWEAIDRLCKAGALRYDTSSRSGFGSGQGTLVLMADRVGRGAVSDSGPFRVQVTDVQALFERDFLRGPGAAGKGANARDGGDLTVKLAVLAEPGLQLHPNGPVSVAEAVDDRGRSLVLPHPKPADTAHPAFQADFTGKASIHVAANLLAPDPPGEAIRRLRGKVPVVVVTRGADPTVVRLEDVGGEHSVVTPDMTLIIDEVSLAPAAGGRASVRVTIRPKRFNDFERRGSGGRPPNFAAFNRDRVLERLEFRDAAGHRLPLGPTGQTRGADGKGFYDRYVLQVAPAVGDGPPGAAVAANAPVPSELRYYELVQATAEIPFDFRDVPMP